MKHEHKIYFDCSPELAALIQPLLRLPITLKKMETRIMAALDKVQESLAAANAKADAIGTDITEIASDLAEVIAKLAEGQPGSEDVKAAEAAAEALVARLTSIGDASRTVAQTYPPPA